MSQLDKPSTISKLYTANNNNRRFKINASDTHNNIPAKTYKHTETEGRNTSTSKCISTQDIDGVKHTVYDQFPSITHIYNNRGVLSTTTHNNTFTYVV